MLIKTEKDPPGGLVLTAFIALYLIWGSTYLANLIAIKTVPPFMMAGTRFTLAGVLLYLWSVIKGQKTPGMSDILKISFGGVLMLFVGTGAVIWVEQYIPSGLTAVIVATVPLWFVALDRREWHIYFNNRWIIAGLLVGFSGVVLLFTGKGNVDFAANHMQMVSFFILVGGSICWTIGSLYSKYKPVDVSTSVKAAFQMIAAGLVSFLFAFLINEQDHFILSEISWISIKAILYLVFFGSLIGYMSYIFLLSVRSPSIVGTYAYVNPVVAVFLGWLIEGEKIETVQVIALVVILSGVIMVTIAKSKNK